MDVHEQRLMPGKSSSSVETAGSSRDLCPQQNCPAEEAGCTEGAGAAATAIHDEILDGLHRARQTLLSIGKSPADWLIKGLDAEIQASQLSAAAAVVQIPAASADL